MYANWVKEQTNTAGTGTMTLTAVTGFCRFADVFANGDICYYAIQDGANREQGIGTVGAANTLARTTIFSKLVAGVLTLNPGTGITLSGVNASVYVDQPKELIFNSTKGTTINVAATTDVWASKTGHIIDIVGVGTTLTSFGTPSRIGDIRIVRCATTQFLLTTGSNLVYPGVSGNVTVFPGDTLFLLATSATQTTVALLQKADGTVPASYLQTAGGTMGAGNTVDWNNGTLGGLGVAAYKAEFDNGNSGSAKTIDFSANGSVQKITLNANTTLTLASPPTGSGHCQLRLIQDGTGSRTVTWAGTPYSASRWIGSAAAPAILTAAASETIVNFFYTDGGNWYQQMGHVGAI